ncbi:hypothetical protein D3C78_714290 [compost metagenome]
MLLDIFLQLALQLVKVVQHTLYGAVLMKQLKCCLLSNAGHTRDIIGRIAHKPLQINDLFRG